jgi:predicted cation transporter
MRNDMNKRKAIWFISEAALFAMWVVFGWGLSGSWIIGIVAAVVLTAVQYATDKAFNVVHY